MKKYEGQSDEALLQKLQEGEADVAEYLIKKYKYLVLRKARAMYLMGGDTDDLIQEGMLGLFKAIQGYRVEKEASFATFAKLCIERQMYTAVQAAARQKHQPLNSYISFSDSEGEETEEMPYIQDPESILIDQEHVATVEKKIKALLSPMENQVLERYLDGKDYIKIAEELNKTPKSMDNAIQRIRGKVRNYLEAKERKN